MTRKGFLWKQKGLKQSVAKKPSYRGARVKDLRHPIIRSHACRGCGLLQASFRFLERLLKWPLPEGRSPLLQREAVVYKIVSLLSRGADFSRVFRLWLRFRHVFQFYGQELGRAVVAQGDAIEFGGLMHGGAIMRDHNELRAVGEVT